MSRPAAPRYALKALTVDGDSPCHAHEWSLPTQTADGTWTPGRWSSVDGVVEYRRNGLHLATVSQIGWWVKHLRGRVLVTWVVEYEGAVSRGAHGFAARRARLVRPWDGVETL